MSLQVWLPLNGDLRNQGLSDLTFSNENTTNLSISASGKIGSCYQRASKCTTGRIISDKTINLDNDFSMCCWAYVMDTVGDTANGLVTNHSNDDNTGSGINVKQISTSDYRICCNTGTGSSRTFNTHYGTTNIKDAWHHLALTYSKAKARLQLWVDGKVEYTLGNYTNASKSDYIILFDWSTSFNNSKYRPACKLNDVRIYDHCLSAKEVKEISKGLVLHYKMDNNGFGNPNLIQSSIMNATSSSYGFGTRSFSLKNSTTYTITICGKVDSKTQDDSKYLRVYIYDSGWKYWSVSYSLTETIPTIKSFTFTTLGNIEAYTVNFTAYYYPSGGTNYGTVTLYWVKLEEGSKATLWCPNPSDADYSSLGLDSSIEYDCSGFGNNGTKVGAITPDSDTPRYDVSTKALSENIGTSTSTGMACVYSNKGLTTPSALTFAFWLKPINWSYQNSGILSTTANSYPSDYETSAVNQYDDKFRFNASDGTNVTVSATSLINDTNWHHYAFTFDGINVKVYKDGALTSLGKSFSAAKTLGSFNKVFLGLSQAGGAWRQTSLYWSDFRMYATALSADDIKALYNTPISIDANGNIHAYEFKED